LLFNKLELFKEEILKEILFQSVEEIMEANEAIQIEKERKKG
jgi:hypothetical protein